MKNDIELNKNIEDYLNYLQYERKLSKNTYASYRYNLIKISEFFKDEDLIKLNEEHFYIIQKRVVRQMLTI